MQSQPNSRFNQYTQIISKGQVVGFKLDNINFQFLFDQYGGWYDQQGKYYNSQAILSEPPIDDDDIEENDEEQNKNKQQYNNNNDNEKQYVQIKQDKRLQVVKNLYQIIDSYPQGKQISILLSLSPQISKSDQLIQQFLHSKLLSNKNKIHIKNNSVTIQSHQLAKSICEYEGSLISSSTLYIDISLFNSIQIIVQMRKDQLIQKLTNQLKYQENVDFGNIQEVQYQKGKYQCVFDINTNIQKNLKQEMEFQRNQ